MLPAAVRHEHMRVNQILHLPCDICQNTGPRTQVRGLGSKLQAHTLQTEWMSNIRCLPEWAHAPKESSQVQAALA